MTELQYIDSHWIYTDHNQFVTGSAGLSYLWNGTRFSADMIYGSGLRDGDANTGTVPAYTQFNLGATHDFAMPDGKPLTVRFDVVNLFDSIYLIRDGSGIGVFAPQYGPRRGYFVGVSKKIKFTNSGSSMWKVKRSQQAEVPYAFILGGKHWPSIVSLCAASADLYVLRHGRIWKSKSDGFPCDLPTAFAGEGLEWLQPRTLPQHAYLPMPSRRFRKLSVDLVRSLPARYQQAFGKMLDRSSRRHISCAS
jgi:hypothetical protein